MDMKLNCPCQTVDLNFSQTTAARLMGANDSGSREGKITLVKQIRHVNLTNTLGGINWKRNDWGGKKK